MPLVARTRVAIGLGYGAQHSLDPAALFGLFPGWRVVAPSTPFDYIGLFNAAMDCGSPTLIVEHQALYPRKGQGARRAPRPPRGVGQGARRAPRPARDGGRLLRPRWRTRWRRRACSRRTASRPR